MLMPIMRIDAQDRICFTHRDPAPGCPSLPQVHQHQPHQDSILLSLQGITEMDSWYFAQIFSGIPSQMRQKLSPQTC